MNRRPSAGLIPLLLLALLNVGCTQKPTTPIGGAGGGDVVTQSSADAEKQLRSALERGGDAAVVREALQRFGAGMDRTQTTLAAEKQAELKKLFRLMPEEVVEVERVDYSGLDSRYLEEAFFDALDRAALNLDGKGVPEQGKALLDWVNRQIYLRQRDFPPLPVWFTLQSGFGSREDRAYVLLELARQLNLDPVLVGTPALGDSPSFKSVADMERPNSKAIDPPFWAVGIRSNNQILLMNPLTCRFFPGSKGEGIATLQEAVTTPLAEEWVKAGLKLPVPVESIAKSEVYLASPLSSLSARMRMLDAILQGGMAARLAVDPPGVTGRLKLVAGVKDVRVWNPPLDLFTPTRVLSRFVPADQGSLEPTRGMLLTQEGTVFPLRGGESASNQVVPLAFALLIANVSQAYFPKELRLSQFSEGYRALRANYFEQFGPLLPNSGSGRDRMLKGQFNEAVNYYSALKEQAEANYARAVNEPNLVAKAQQAYDEFEAAEATDARLSRSGPPAEAAQARAAVDLARAKFVKESRPLMIRATARAINAEATYQLALCVHEKAIRIQATPGTSKESALDAWRNAEDWWRVCVNNFPDLRGANPERDAQARMLMEEAKRALK